MQCEFINKKKEWNMNGKNIGRTVSWVYYKDEKLIGGSAFDIQLFRQILENNAKFSSQAQEMIETQIK